MELAHSVIVKLKKGEGLPTRLSFNGKAKDYIHAINMEPLPEEEEKAFWDLFYDWDNKAAGLFVDRDSVLGFVMMIQIVFEKKYQIEYHWIGGADPYAYWEKSQEENPEGTVY